ncbi:DNA topoisomerase I [Candidatus Woesearchaeota archaeon]|nr:DNA topoisomerase I [Candidatus Woesearchaeota archaeon]
MSYELIITEKPSAANKIAEALSDSKPTKKNVGGAVYYEIKHGGKNIVVGCAVGHLYTVVEKDKGKNGWTYPIFETKWVESSKANKESAYTSKYLNLLKKLAKDANKYTVATDYDIEGEVIGYNIIKYACKQSDARRMKFSTLTKHDLVKSYAEASKHLIKGQVRAGVTRHELDWLYGINLSRALTLSMRAGGGGFRVLSSGRVQGPALKTIVDKEKEIQKFKPVPFWQISLTGKREKTVFDGLHEADKFDKESEAKKVYDKVKAEKKGVVDSVKKNQSTQRPPTPFDLTTLQIEAHRTLSYTPKRTLDIAQSLYIEGLISYPRTSSQKLPAILGFKNILTKLSAQPDFKKDCDYLLKKGKLIPNEGAKTDEAHPAIYPTGNKKKLDEQQQKVYELIVRRFFAVFGDPAKRETMTVRILVKDEGFIVKGTRTIEQGWHALYGRFVMQKEEELPGFLEKENVHVDKISLDAKETKPPGRYSEASIIKELEKRNLGTKSTRAQIIENLYDRGYIKDKSIVATELGIKTVDVLDKYSPLILDEKLTNSFEEEMELIRKEEHTHDGVINKAKKVLGEILTDFKSKEKVIGKELAEANKETMLEATQLGPCKKCKGTLTIKRGKYGYFVACDKYPDCKVTFNLPSNGHFSPAKKDCEKCSFPMVLIKRAKKKPMIACINPECPTRMPTDPEARKEEIELENGKIEKECPKCRNPLMIRNSVYGKFLGCTTFPKCHYTERIKDGPLKEDFKEKKKKKK